MLLSSHLLHEIEVAPDDLVVIGHGRIVASGTRPELLASAGTIVRADRLAPTLARALTADGRTSTSVDGGRLVDAEPSRWSAGLPQRAGVPPHRSSAPPAAPASKRCSSSSPLRPPAKE